MGSTRRTIQVSRFDPEVDAAPRLESFVVNLRPRWTLLMALLEIASRHDASLAFRRSCRSGICGSCAVTVSGQNRLACETQVSELPDPIIVEPLRAFPVIKDLVVDMREVFDRYELVRPWLIPKEPPPDGSEGKPGGKMERLQSPAERRKLNGLYDCITCGACTSSCPSFWASRDYLGPQALQAAARFVFDSRDGAAKERIEALDHSGGLWRCHDIFNCAEACPKGLNPGEAIARLRRRALRKRLLGR